MGFVNSFMNDVQSGVNVGIMTFIKCGPHVLDFEDAQVSRCLPNVNKV